MTRALTIAALALGLAAPAGAAETPVAAVYAYQDAPAKTSAYLRATPAGGDTLDRRLDLWFTKPGSTAALRSYDVDMTKKLHLIIVSDDLQRFYHIHPLLRADGHFTIAQRFGAPGLYHVYADATPTGIGRQVQRFDLSVGDGAAVAAARKLPPAALSAKAGAYTVTLDTVALDAGTTTMLNVRVREHGKAASDLHPYLGALAHAVFLNTRDLSYVHAHPMAAGTDMSHMSMEQMMEPPELPDGAPAAPNMMLHVNVREPGTYKLWFQFRGSDGLHVATFVLTAEKHR